MPYPDRSHKVDLPFLWPKACLRVFPSLGLFEPRYGK